MLDRFELLPSSDDSYWNDFQRLIFKCLIDKRQKTIGNDKEFFKILINVESLSDIVEKKTKVRLINFEIKDQIKDLDIIEDLIKVEFFEHAHIFPKFAFMIKHFYPKDDSKIVDYGKLLEFFGRKRYNQNVLLKYLISMFDPREGMRACIIKEDSYSKNLSHHHPSEKEKDLENLAIKGPENVPIDNVKYVSDHVMEFFLEKNRRFQPGSCDAFFYFLKKLNKKEPLRLNFSEKRFDLQFACKYLRMDRNFHKMLDYCQENNDSLGQMEEWRNFQNIFQPTHWLHE